MDLQNSFLWSVLFRYQQLKKNDKTKWWNKNIHVKEHTELTREEIERLIDETEERLKELEKYGKNLEYIQELSNLAFLQLEVEQYTKSEKNLQVCLNHFKKQRDNLGKASVYGILGILHFKSGAYQTSIDYYNIAYKIYKEFNQVEEQITCLKGIGINLIKLNKFDEACDNLLECSALCSDNNDIYNLLDCLGNLIFINEKQEHWDVVFELYKKTLKAFKELHDIKGIIVSYFNLGILKKRGSDFNQAIRYFKKGTNIAIDSNYIELILKGLGYIGEILVYQGNLNAAKEVYIKALSTAEKFKVKNSIIQIKILLKSLGLNEEEIENELRNYRNLRIK